MKDKKKSVPQVSEERIRDLLEIRDKLEQLPEDKLMYIAGAVAAMATEQNAKRSG